MIAEKINYIILHHCYPNLKYHQDHRCLRRRCWCPRGSAHFTGSRGICKVAEENKPRKSDCRKIKQESIFLHDHIRNITKTKHLPTSGKLVALNNIYITLDSKPITPNTKYTAPNTKHIPTRAHR